MNYFEIVEKRYPERSNGKPFIIIEIGYRLTRIGKPQHRAHIGGHEPHFPLELKSANRPVVKVKDSFE